MKNLFVILGNQLFHPKLLKEKGCTDVFMAEDFGLCTYVKHHKLKIYFFLCSMREYADELRTAGINVHYFKLSERDENQTYAELLCSFLREKKVANLNLFEIEDKSFELPFLKVLANAGITYSIMDSPMFMFSRKDFSDFHKGLKQFRMNSFYIFGRKKFDILLDNDQKPVGGKWSYDAENRKKIPTNTVIPELPKYKISAYHKSVSKLIKQHFSHHPGELNEIWFPVRRKDVSIQLEKFLEERLNCFGVYEDALVEGKNFLFHSCLSLLLNIGLITPDEIVEKTLEVYEKHQLPLNSVEGFLRQIIGWREFIRGIYQEKGDVQAKSNFFKHSRSLASSWYEGTTGILPLDDSINKAIRDGYNHHIPRLMVISNIMNLCEINPKYIYNWFMEMYVDSSDWVMVPNVFGMATYSDGGLMSTKPYTCGSNYILKMSNYKRGDWCDTLDGLYWRFIEKHIDFYKSNPRLSFIHKTLERMSSERKLHIFEKAKLFIENNTHEG